MKVGRYSQEFRPIEIVLDKEREAQLLIYVLSNFSLLTHSDTLGHDAMELATELVSQLKRLT